MIGYLHEGEEITDHPATIFQGKFKTVFHVAQVGLPETTLNREELVVQLFGFAHIPGADRVPDVAGTGMDGDPAETAFSF